MQKLKNIIAKAYSKVLLIAGALSLLLLAKKNEEESENTQRRYISLPKRRKYATVDMAARRMY